MPLPQITFTKQDGGLGRPLTGEDHISGMVMYSNSLPAGFGTDTMKTVFSLQQAEALGIVEGSASFGVLWYHIREYFRLQSKGVLHVGIFPVPAGAYDFAEVKTLQVFANGKIRQVAVYAHLIAGVSTANATALHNRCVELFADHMPLIAMIATDISAIADLSTLTDLRDGTSSYYVSWVIGQDGNGLGKALYDSLGYSITCLGAVLGAVSLAQVHQNIGWVRTFKASDTELDVPAFANGDLYSSKATSELNSINDAGYIFLRRYVGKDGSFFNDSHTVVATTSDYYSIEQNRTIDKVVRNVYAALVDEINGPVEVDADTGKLATTYVEYLKSLGDQSLLQMERDGELSGYETIIDPDQDIAATSNIEVSVNLVGIGVARIFSVNVGYQKSLS